LACPVSTSADRLGDHESRLSRRIIWFNFAGTLAVDSIGMGLAAVGLLNPLFATFIHASSVPAFNLNSARLLPGVSRRR
jgi:P-type Cu+ transporter